MEEKLKQYLNALIKHEGSDLHLQSGSIPRARIQGELRVLGKEILTNEDLEKLSKEISSEKEYKRLVEEKNLDFSYVLEDKYRFRINFFYQLNGLSAVFRIIPVDIMSIEDLKLPKVIHDFTKIKRGLVLVTGVTGSGKSTTLAAIIDKINRDTKDHIITIEDPIEFIHKNKGCLVNQRGVGQDTHSFSDALKGALREDPDIILVGEMRDLDTIDIAMHAANTGHLVFSTLHTLDAKETIDRIIGMFPSNEQNRIRGSLASVLEGIVSQRLIPSVDGKRVAAIEVLKKTGRIEQLIAEGRDNEITDAIAEGKEIYGTQTFDQAIFDLYNNEKITKETALEYATNPSDMKLKMQGISGTGTVGKTESLGKGSFDKSEFFELNDNSEEE